MASFACDGHPPFEHGIVLTCGSVGSLSVYSFTEMPEAEPPAELPERKFVSSIKASSLFFGSSGV